MFLLLLKIHLLHFNQSCQWTEINQHKDQHIYFDRLTREHSYQHARMHQVNCLPFTQLLSICCSISMQIQIKQSKVTNLTLEQIIHSLL